MSAFERATSQVVGADALIGPKEQAPTPAKGARSEAERAERSADQMRPCTPSLVGTRAAGINCQVSAVPRRARRTVPANPQAPSHADSRI